MSPRAAAKKVAPAKKSGANRSAFSSAFLRTQEEIDRALAKFALGTYGICEVSGELIPKEHLEATPWARERGEFVVGGFGRR